MRSAISGGSCPSPSVMGGGADGNEGSPVGAVVPLGGRALRDCLFFRPLAIPWAINLLASLTRVCSSISTNWAHCLTYKDRLMGSGIRAILETISLIISDRLTGSPTVSASNKLVLNKIKSSA